MWWTYAEDGERYASQYEYEYCDYNLSGDVVSTGSEDFSPVRLSTDTDYKWLWVWDGLTYNKGGKRKFECYGLVRYRTQDKKEVLKHFKNIYKCALVQLR